MSIETAYPPSPKPRRGDMYRLKIVQTLVMPIDAIEIFRGYMESGIQKAKALDPDVERG